jgi:hypothetical protein
MPTFKEIREEAAALPTHPSNAKSTEPEKEFKKVPEKASDDSDNAKLGTKPSDASADVEADEAGDAELKKGSKKDAPKELDGVKIAKGAGNDGVQNEAKEEEDDDAAKKEAEAEDDKLQKEAEEEEEKEAGDEEEKEEKKEKDIEEHVEALVNGEELSESFKEKATVILSAAVNERVEIEKAKLEKTNEAVVAQKVDEEVDKIVDHLDNYLDYIVNEWIEENKLSLESGIRSEISENFLNGLKSLFLENNFELPSESEELVIKERKAKEDAQVELENQVEKNIELKAQLEALQKNSALENACKDLTTSEADRLKELTKTITFECVDVYEKKLSVIKENYFQKSSDAEEKSGVLSETGLEKPENEAKSEEESDPSMAAYSDAISRAVRNSK